MTKIIAIDLFDGTEKLDALGPREALSYWAQTYPDDGWQKFDNLLSTEPTITQQQDQRWVDDGPVVTR